MKVCPSSAAGLRRPALPAGAFPRPVVWCYMSAGLEAGMDARVAEEIGAEAAAGASARGHERRVLVVGALSLVAMGVELVAGVRLNSLALLSDGLHTSTHVGVMAVSAAAYVYARRHALDPRFAFGPAKVGDLAAFASGAGLAVVALFIALESVQRLVRPEAVALGEAAAVAGLSLLVGLVSAAVLRRAHTRAHVDAGCAPDHGHAHGHDQGHVHGRDLNLWAAYMHMLADVITSVLAIGALLVGAALGWTWLDAAVGLVNAAVVAVLAANLLRRAAWSLLDMRPTAASHLPDAVREGAAATAGVRVWHVGPGRLAVVVPAVLARAPGLTRSLLRTPGVAHVLVEVDPTET